MVACCDALPYESEVALQEMVDQAEELGLYGDPPWACPNCGEAGDPGHHRLYLHHDDAPDWVYVCHGSDGL